MKRILKSGITRKVKEDVIIAMTSKRNQEYILDAFGQ